MARAAATGMLGMPDINRRAWELRWAVACRGLADTGEGG
ncbi:hypothetical protein STRIP9103_08650 [Streptomyces ipomoeae 91-03]|jgi:hypothetical protein|uniref:Uncharacterized protein n=1 Tax=Streptomyces ipomoeae 91-03 TaxID=698759 RepID=L1L491_9ACTN|nr:hypothetical protein STRIP9103_08650 [Streptomyces ipomoeae 91-03]